MDKTTQGKYILKDEKRRRLPPGSTLVSHKLARGKENGLLRQSSTLETKGEYFNSVEAAEVPKRA